MTHSQPHKLHTSNGLRAAVMGANDGLVSTASLLIGMAAAGADQATLALAGLASLVAGGMSMAAGEFVSVSSQSDLENAELALEAESLLAHPEAEQQELAHIYQQRGLEPELAEQVAAQLMAHDALAAHARDDIGLTDEQSSNPIQAALFSGLAFAVGAGLPVLLVMLFNIVEVMPLGVISVLFLMILGASAAKLSASSRLKGALRVGLLGGLAMLVSIVAGEWIGTII